MINTVQLVLADPVYAAAVREALTRSGPWHIASVEQPDPRQTGVLVIDEDALDHLPLPLPHPERVVLVTHKDPQRLSAAWDAGIVSVVSVDDPPNTVLLAIMAATLRLPKADAATAGGGISPSAPQSVAPITSEFRPLPQKRLKTP
jgi:DNA-binding NarL/FixJ family response regulator